MTSSKKVGRKPGVSKEKGKNYPVVLVHLELRSLAPGHVTHWASRVRQ